MNISTIGLIYCISAREFSESGCVQEQDILQGEECGCMSMGRKFAVVVKGLIIAYAVTGVLLALLAFLVFRFHISESVTDIAIVAIYVLVTFVGAFITGKTVKERKFMWGLLLGVLYILIISVVAIAIGQVFQVTSTANMTTAALCIGGGLLGGMLS